MWIVRDWGCLDFLGRAKYLVHCSSRWPCNINYTNSNNTTARPKCSERGFFFFFLFAVDSKLSS